MAIDPVCKMQVDEKKAVATSEYNGKTYYFCAADCKKAFDSDPQSWRLIHMFVDHHIDPDAFAVTLLPHPILFEEKHILPPERKSYKPTVYKRAYNVSLRAPNC